MKWKWVEIEQGYTVHIPELGLNMYLLKAKKGWVGTGSFTYNIGNRYNTKPFKHMEDAKISLVNMLVTGLCKCQFELMAMVSTK